MCNCNQNKKRFRKQITIWIFSLGCRIITAKKGCQENIYVLGYDISDNVYHRFNYFLGNKVFV